MKEKFKKIYVLFHNNFYIQFHVKEKMADNVYNHFKLAFHKEKIEALAKEEITSPIYVRVKPTNKCNHHCFYCAYGIDSLIKMDRKSEIPKEKMIEILKDLIFNFL